ncbi:hypothetical protein P1P68_28990 [Streptomyces scabiei]|uniref:hypothetical protein n=1 Tax=Streptomyces scabiei TaxID=1930 RepID=UPI0029906B46|nr:hypothetical protein [Streptomyces scabiei]MDW8808721.1 hypothetical protein [Streptomyces scabiei]
MAATLAWSTSGRTRRHLRGGFEGEGMDYTVLATELPFVALAGAAVPAAVCLLIASLWARRRRTVAGPQSRPGPERGPQPGADPGSGAGRGGVPDLDG